MKSNDARKSLIKKAIGSILEGNLEDAKSALHHAINDHSARIISQGKSDADVADVETTK